MRKFDPKVSIIIPVYNGSDYVREAIDSALNQSYKNIEVIVINDGSNDDYKTEGICKSYGNRIRYFKKENGGVASALNMGIEKMKGEYFSWLSHDDVYYPNKLEIQVEELRKLEDRKALLFSSLEIIDENGKHLINQEYGDLYPRELLDVPLFAFFHLALNGCTLLIHKSHFTRVGVFNTKLPTTQDYDLWFRMFRESNVHYVDKILVKSRSHVNQGSKLLINEHIDECNHFWEKTLSSITKEEKREIAGSELDFYSNLYHSFKTLTGYNKVISYLYKMMLEEYLKEFHKEKNPEKKEKIRKEITSRIYGDERDEKKFIQKLLNISKKKKPRIVFYTANWHDRAGLNRIISRISSLLSNQYEVFVICTKEEGNETGYPLDSKVKFLEFEESHFSFLPSLLKLLEVDIFIGSNNCFIPLLNMYNTMEEIGVKVIMWNHEHFFVPYYEESLQESIPIRNKVFDEVTVALWLTEFSANLGRVFGDRVGIMRNTLSFSNKETYEWKPEDFNIISLARFNSPRKHLDRLLIVFSKIVRKIPDAKLYILGQYDLNIMAEGEKNETVAELLARLKIPEGNIVFLGEVKDVKKYYSKAKVNVMTSEREGFGLTILEAALFGIPSVVFDGGGMSDIITDQVNGLVIENGNTDLMAKEIVKLLKDKEFFKKLSKGASLLTKEYSEELISKKWIELIDGVLNLERNKLPLFLKEKFSQGINEKVLGSKEYRQAVVSYENAIKHLIDKTKGFNTLIKKDDNIVEQKNKSLSKLIWLLRKIEHSIELIEKQGLRTTMRNIILKILKK